MKEMLRSLKKDFSSAFFYWLTFSITAMFIFLFFTVAMSSEIGVTMVNARNDIATNLMVFAVILCSIDIVFANNFFIKKKAKELAVRLICGGTYVQLAGFLLSQTVLLLILAIPVGISGGLITIPIINQVVSHVLQSSFHVAVTFDAILWTTLVLGYVVFWTLILNLSFAYKNSARELLDDTGIKISGESFQISVPMSERVSKILCLIIFIGPVLLFYTSKDLLLVNVLVSLLGFMQFYGKFVFPAIEKRIQNNIDQPDRIAYLGFFRNDLKLLKMNLVLFLVSSIILVSILLSAETTMDILLVLITYITMSFLLSLAIMFKLSSDIPSRIRYYKTLDHIGFMEGDLKKIIRKEVVLLYGFVICIIVFYLSNMFGSLLIRGNMTLLNAGILLMASIIPLMICGLINIQYYKNTVLGNRKGK